MKEKAFLETPHERKIRIFRERARRLAGNSVVEVLDEGLMEVVEFSLGEELYAVESRYVGEVFSLGRMMTPIPCTPPLVAGVVNLRGKIVSLVDLKVLFEIPRGEEPKTQKVILLRWEAMEFGLLADDIPGISTILFREVHPPLPVLVGVRKAYIMGMEENGCALLDGRKLLKDEALVVNEEA